jgi:hypothetical protein
VHLTTSTRNSTAAKTGKTVPSIDEEREGEESLGQGNGD